jgi:hypothetical protein
VGASVGLFARLIPAPTALFAGERPLDMPALELFADEAVAGPRTGASVGLLAKEMHLV